MKGTLCINRKHPLFFFWRVVVCTLVSFVLSSSHYACFAENLWHTRHFDESDGMSNSMAFCLYQDVKGFLWLGTKDGLNWFDGRQFRVWRQDEGLFGKTVYDIAADSAGRLWLATDMGVCRFSPRENSFYVPVTYDNFRPEKIAQPTRINFRVQHVVVDSKDRVWVLAGKRVFVYRDGHLSDITSSLMQQLGFFPTEMVAGDDGTVYFANRKEGSVIVWYDPDEDAVRKTLSLPYKVTALCKAPNGKIFLGTQHDGLFSCDTTGLLTQIPMESSSEERMRTSGIIDICCGSDSCMVSGVASEEGLLWLRGDTLVLLYSTRKSPMSLYDIPWRVLADRDGGLWTVDFNGGISYHIRKQTSLLSLPLKELKDTLGEDENLQREKIFGVRDSVSCTDSECVRRFRPVVFAEIYHDGREVLAGLPYVDTVRLAHNQASFTVRLSVVDYSHSQEHRLMYCIDGLDDNWKEVASDGYLSCKLRTGEYTIHAIEHSSSDITADEANSGNQASLTIIVAPSFWNTPTAYGLYVLCAMGVFTAFFLARRFHQSPSKCEESSSPELADTDSSRVSKEDEIFLHNISIYLKTHMTQGKIDYDAMAFALNMSRSTFHRRVRSVTGFTPNEYCRMLQLDWAAELLKNENLLVKEVCTKVGFSSVSYFAKVFQKRFGVLPGDYVSSKNGKPKK